MFAIPGGAGSTVSATTGPAVTPAPPGALLQDRETLLQASATIAALREDLRVARAERDAARHHAAQLQEHIDNSAAGALVAKHKAVADALDRERLEAVTLRGEIEQLRRTVQLLSISGGVCRPATSEGRRAAPGAGTSSPPYDDDRARREEGPSQFRLLPPAQQEERSRAVEHENKLLRSAVHTLEERLHAERAVAKKAADVLNATAATAHTARLEETVRRLTHELAERNGLILDLRQLLLAHAATATPRHGIALSAPPSSAFGGPGNRFADTVASLGGDGVSAARRVAETMASPTARQLGGLSDQLRRRRTAAGIAPYEQFLSPT